MQNHKGPSASRLRKAIRTAPALAIYWPVKKAPYGYAYDNGNQPTIILMVNPAQLNTIKDYWGRTPDKIERDGTIVWGKPWHKRFTRTRRTIRTSSPDKGGNQQ